MTVDDRSAAASRHVAQGFERHRTGDVEGAARNYEAAIALAPDHGDARYLLGLVEITRGRFDPARAHIEIALQADPANAHYLFAAGEVARALNDRDSAIRAFEAALTIDGTEGQRWAQLGDLYLAAGRPSAAEECARKATRLEPQLHNAWHLLGESVRAQARADEAIAHYREAARLANAYGPPLESLLMTLNFSDRVTPQQVAEEHRRGGAMIGPWGVRGEAAAPWLVDPRALDGSRPLRVGYVSADFGLHVVSFFIEPVLAAHDRGAVEVFCYFAAPHDDPRSAQVQGHAAHWRSLVGLDDDAAAALMRADGLDIAVDLSGHTRGNRLGVLARRVAPVQATWLGYPNTSGVLAIDYRLTDAWCDPPGMTEAYHTERLWRLDQGFLAYVPLRDVPPVGPVPALARGHVTFGCFNNPPKITDTCLRLWAELLSQVPGSRLLLKGKGLEEPSVGTMLRSRFRSVGGDPEHLDLDGGRPDFREHLARYGDVDVALDTYPYHGTTTTCEALMMGVPVVSLAGPVHAARVGASLLTRVGHPEWVAADAGQYVAIAADLARDRERLTRIRSGLRWQLSHCALGDVSAFTRALEAGYRAMLQAAARER
ncbi:MAG: tetratricopeptide repeat protein [Burkholderiales bacterium]|nr:tetratricopeptide repeat protein [Burkholderiales bacterium]